MIKLGESLIADNVDLNGVVKLNNNDMNWVRKTKRILMKMLEKKGYTFSKNVDNGDLTIGSIITLCEMANAVLEEYGIKDTVIEVIDGADILPLKRQLSFLKYVKFENEKREEQKEKVQYIEKDPEKMEAPNDMTSFDDTSLYESISHFGIPIGVDLKIVPYNGVWNNCLYSLFINNNFAGVIEPQSGPAHGRSGGSILLPYKDENGNVLSCWISVVSNLDLIRKHFEDPTAILLTEEDVQKCTRFWDGYMFDKIRPNRKIFSRIATLSNAEYFALGRKLETAMKFLDSKSKYESRYRIVEFRDKDHFTIASDNYTAFNQCDPVNHMYMKLSDNVREYGMVDETYTIPVNNSTTPFMQYPNAAV